MPLNSATRPTRRTRPSDVPEFSPFFLWLDGRTPAAPSSPATSSPPCSSSAGRFRLCDGLACFRRHGFRSGDFTSLDGSSCRCRYRRQCRQDSHARSDSGHRYRQGGETPDRGGGGRVFEFRPRDGAEGSQEGRLRLDDHVQPKRQARARRRAGPHPRARFVSPLARVFGQLGAHRLTRMRRISVVCCVRFSPDGKVLATGCNRNTTLYDTKTGARIA
jgi:hypothetical protein